MERKKSNKEEKDQQRDERFFNDDPVIGLQKRVFHDKSLSVDTNLFSTQEGEAILTLGENPLGEKRNFLPGKKGCVVKPKAIRESKN
jgi:hypothetical protein